jgi:hypothetical protein
VSFRCHRSASSVSSFSLRWSFSDTPWARGLLLRNCCRWPAYSISMMRPSLDRLHYAVIVHSLTPSSLISPVLGLPPLSPLYDINRLVHSGGLNTRCRHLHHWVRHRSNCRRLEIGFSPERRVRRNKVQDRTTLAGIYRSSLY